MKAAKILPYISIDVNRPPAVGYVKQNMNTATQQTAHISRVCMDAQREIDVLVNAVEDRIGWLYADGQHHHVDLDSSLGVDTIEFDELHETHELPASSVRPLRGNRQKSELTQTLGGAGLYSLLSKAVDIVCDFFDAGPIVEPVSVRRATANSTGTDCGRKVRMHRCALAALVYLVRDLSLRPAGKVDNK